jgi:hypothetical protein
MCGIRSRAMRPLPTCTGRVLEVARHTYVLKYKPSYRTIRHARASTISDENSPRDAIVEKNQNQSHVWHKITCSARTAQVHRLSLEGSEAYLQTEIQTIISNDTPRQSKHDERWKQPAGRDCRKKSESVMAQTGAHHCSAHRCVQAESCQKRGILTD